jgi:FkbM family methyltransferase
MNGIALHITRLGLRVVGGAIDLGLGLLPARLRVMIVDRAALVRPLAYDKCTVLLHVDSEFEYKVRLHSAAREPETVRWIEQFLDGDVFYDIGANVGAYSLIAAKLFAGRVKVYAFEPSALNFSQLVRNLALNRCGETVMPLPIALADATEPQVFNYQNVTRGGAMHALGSTTGEQGRSFVPALRQHLLAYSLDDLVEHYHLELPSHIKIDVDGCEPRILAGAARTLKSPSLRSVLFEASAEDTINQRMVDALAASGFRLGARHMFPGGLANLLFVRGTA